MPVLNAAALLEITLPAIFSGNRVPDEVIVVDDGSTDGSAERAASLGARVLTMRENRGPAACRNLAAVQASGDVLVFLDADTRVHPDTLQLLVEHLQNSVELSAVMGAYDRTPTDPGVCSRFRNLSHCYVHRASCSEAQTFWSGCGAIRRSAFLRAGGFDERFARPSVEDIDLGYCLTNAGERVLLDPRVTVTHLKRWTVASSIVTDIWDRGIPWTLLLLRLGRAPNDLNLTWLHRVSACLAALMIACLGMAVFHPVYIAFAVACAIGSLSLQQGMLRFVCKGKGAFFWFGAMALCLLQEMCKLVAAAGGVAFWLAGVRRGPRQSVLLSCAQKAQERLVRREFPAESATK